MSVVLDTWDAALGNPDEAGRLENVHKKYDQNDELFVEGKGSMKFWFVVFVIGAFVLVTAGSANAQRIVISTLMDQDPVTIIAERVMTQAYQRLGLTMEIRHFPGERALQTANAGLVDGELFRKREGIEQNYPNLIRIPVAITVAEFVVFSKNKRFPVTGWSSLLPYKVGYVRGVKAIEEHLVKGTKAEAVTDHALAFRKLEAGRSDVVIAVRATGLITLKQLNMQGVSILEPPLLTIDLYHFLHVKNQKLVQPLTSVLLEMEKEGIIRDTIEQVIQASVQ